MPAGSRAQDTDTSAETSTNTTPNGSNTPTGTVTVPGRDRSRTVIACPVWDQPTNTTRRIHRFHIGTADASAGPSTSTSAANSRPDTETEEGVDVNMDMSRDDNAPSPSPKQQHRDTGTIRVTHSSRAVGIVSDATALATVGPLGLICHPMRISSSTMMAWYPGLELRMASSRLFGDEPRLHDGCASWGSWWAGRPSPNSRGR